MKYVAGMLSGSNALVADAAHSLSDLLSDVITLFVVDAARVPPDEMYPYGRGRLEAVGSLSVATVLVATAGGVGWSSSAMLLDWWTGAPLGSAVADSGYGVVAIFACVASLVAKEALYHATVKVGNEVGSRTLIANAWHHRSDALSSVAALVGVGGGLMGLPLLDPVAGLLVSGLVAKTGVEIGLQAVHEVTEKAVPDDETRNAVEAAAASARGVVSIDRLRTRKMGPYSLVDLRVEVDPQISVSAAHNVAKHLQSQILSSVPNVSEVLVHIAPAAPRSRAAGHGELMRPYVEVESEVRTALEQFPGIRGVSHVIIHYVPDQGIQVKVDIMCDDEMRIREATAIARKAKRAVMGLPQVIAVDVDLELED